MSYEPTPTPSPRLLVAASGTLSGGAGAATIPFAPGSQSLIAPGAAAACSAIFDFDPADYAVVGKTTQISVVGSVWNGNNTEPSDLSLAIIPVTTIAAGGNITAFGAATTSVLVHAAGASSAMRAGRSSWVTAPAAGFYVLALIIATATTTGVISASARFELRYV